MNNLNVDTKDLETKFLLGLPVRVDGVGEIRSPKLNQVIDIGESKYNDILNYLIFDKKNYDELKEYPDSNFKITCVYYYNDENFRSLFSQGLNLMFNQTVGLSCDENERAYFYLGDESNGKFIYEESFNYIQNVIKIANRISTKDKEPEYKPANNAAQKMIDMLMKNKKDMPKKKENVDLHSIISGVAWKSNNMDITRIGELNICQIYDGFFRLNNIDNYNHTLTGIYTGNVDSKKINMKDINWAKILN